MSHTSSPGTHPPTHRAAAPAHLAPAPGMAGGLGVASLFASGARDVSVNPLLGQQDSPTQQGIASGQGNQGSGGTWFGGQAGTGCDAKSLPRTLKQNTSLRGFV